MKKGKYESLSDRKAFLNETAKGLAALLKGWRFDSLNTHETNAALIGDEGKKIFFRFRSDKPDMITIFTSWPQVHGHANSPADWGVLKRGEAFPGFNYSAGRDLKIIARKIVREVLPEYERLYALCLEAKQAYIKKRESRKIIIDTFKKIHPVSHVMHESCQPLIYFDKLSPEVSAMVQLYHGGNCHLKIDAITPDLAMKILGFIKGQL